MSQKQLAIKELLDRHFNLEPGIQRIFVYSQPDEELVRLIEVNENTIPSGSVMPFAFSATQEVPFTILMADVTPKEWDDIQHGNIKIPDGWPTKYSQEYTRPN